MALMLGGISCAALAGILYNVFREARPASMRDAAATLVCLVISITGMIMGILSCTEADTLRVISWLGILLNAIVVAFCFIAMYNGVVL